MDGGGGDVPIANAPGVTPTKVFLGVLYLKNQDAANAAIGAGAAGGSDARDAYDAVIDLVNKQGGIAGREVVPVYAPLDATSATPADQQLEAACSTWTQDHKVFAILFGGRDVVYECAKKAGALELYSTVTGGGSIPETYERYPNYVDMVGVNLVRLGFVTVNGLATQDYFGEAPKIGMVTWDTPEYRAGIQKGYIPALKRHGLSLATEPAYLTPPQTVQQLSEASAQVNSAVLRFSTLGITHVMLLDGAAGLCGAGCMGLEFMHRAKAQQYYPRYGFNDNNAPIVGQQQGFYPNDQLRRSMSVGWTDLDKSFDEGWRVNAVRERCYELMRKNEVDLSNVNAQAQALAACDELWFMQRISADLGDTPLTVSNVMDVVNAIGSSYQSTSAYGMNLSPTQHDGASAVRNMRFVDSCPCFRYTSRPYVPA